MAAPFQVPEGLEAFVDDEANYLEWYRLHFRGYVLNASRGPSAKYLMMHRVNCIHLTGDLPWTTTDQSKVCGMSKEAIDEWTMSEFGCRADRCNSCQP